MEEIRNENEIMDEVMDENEEVRVIPEETANDGLVKIVVGVGLIVVAGVGALVYKNRGKLDEWRIKKLEKKGYRIYKPVEAEVCEKENGNSENETEE